MHLDDPLSDKEFDELDQFLLSERSPEDSMTMDSLHGFLSAIAVGPEPVPISEWLPHVWGKSEDSAGSEGGESRKQSAQPSFKNSKEEQRILYLITRFMNEIITTLEVAPKDFEPLFCEIRENGKHLIDGEAWAWGFWSGIQLRPQAWQVLEDSEQAPLLHPIYLLGAEEIEEEEMALLDSPQKRHVLAIEMEANLLLIHRFWLPLRKSGVETVKRASPKLGRNDSCACGSGKKVKQCCGRGPTDDALKKP